MVEALEDRTVPSVAVGVTVSAPNTATAGSNISYVVELGSQGPDVAQNFALTDQLPAGTNFVSATQNSGPAFSLSQSGGQVSATIAALSPSTVAYFTIVAAIPATTPNNTTLVDQANITTTTTIASGSTTSASATTTVQNGGGNGGQLVLSNPGNQSNAEGNVVSLAVQASDSSGASVYFGSANLPAGLTIDSQSGVISGTIAYTDADTEGGHYALTITAADTNGATASQSFIWSVSDTITPPVLTNPGDQTNNEGDGVALAPQVSEPDGLPLTWSATGLPAGLAINTSTGLITGALAAGDAAASPYAVTVSVSNGTYSTQQTFNWTVQRIRIDNPGSQSDLEGDAPSLAINAWEPDGAALTYSVSGLPAGLAIDPHFGIISGTVATGAASSAPYNVTVTASDGAASASTSIPPLRE